MRVILDGNDLEVSDVCKEFLRTEGRGYDGAQKFYNKSGELSVSCFHEAFRFMCEQAPFLAVLLYSEPACIAPLNRAHA